MSYFSDLDLRIKANHPDYLDYELPWCCGDEATIIAYDGRLFTFACPKCNREWKARVITWAGMKRFMAQGD